MKLVPLFAALALAAAPAAARAQPAPKAPPKLLVVVSVDQFSADLFAQYRGQFTGGFARLQSGVVFPSGYQGHAATETCPGHSTILTGARPSRTGIIANSWVDFAAPRDDKTVYCAEDERVPGSTSSSYTVSDIHLKVPTLGEWMKAANPAARVVSVAGKDRAAVMMGGHKVDQLWWWDGGAKAFVSYAGRAAPQMVERMNAHVATRLAEAQEPMDLPAQCVARSRPVQVTPTLSVGDGRFARAAGDARAFRASPELDEAVLALGAGLAAELKLGQGPQTDLLILGASATDYVGHGLGPGGGEMCIQLLALDQYLGKLFALLDRTGVDYAVVLTADHGGQDIPERGARGAATVRADPALSPDAMGKLIGADLGLSGPVLAGGIGGDVYVDTRLAPAQQAAAVAAALRRYSAHPQVEAVLTAAQVQATASPQGPPDRWTLLERARASYDPARSGALFVVLRDGVSPVAAPAPGYVATHGTFWDHDRRVPILFWRKGMAHAELPQAVETADIAPTLAALIGLEVPVAIDGKCLDLDPGPADTCR